jgi:RNA polymerase sigma-70 factor (ECF subfamily)
MAEAYHRHIDAIYRFCFRLLLNRSAAEDAAAQVFLNLAQRWGQLASRNDVELRNWLYGEARNAVRSYLQKTKRHSEAMQEVWRREHQRRDGPKDMEIDPAALLAMLKQLKPAQREVMVLRYLEGYSTQETARILGKSRVAVRVTLMRATRKARGLLENLLAE